MRTQLALITVSAVLAAAVGCDAKQKCVADCNGESATDSGSQSGSDTASASATDSGSASAGDVCEVAEQVLASYAADNRSCLVKTDCYLAGAICSTSVPRMCGSTGLSTRGVEDDGWDPLYNGVEAACGSEQCGAAACGADVICNAQAECEAVLGEQGSVGVCDPPFEAARDFIQANRTCTTDEDCVAVDGGCYQGVEHVCTTVSLNADADVAAWQELESDLSACVGGVGCGGPECGPSLRCVESLCEAVFP